MYTKFTSKKNKNKANSKTYNEIKTKDGFKPAKSPTVLIVDDVFSNRFALREILKRQKIAIVEANNGLDALNIVKQSFQTDSKIKIELIFMDLHMPVMTGLDSTIEIRKFEKSIGNSAIPIIAISAQEHEREACIKIGMQEYVAKPVTSAILKRIVCQYAKNLIRFSQPL